MRKLGRMVAPPASAQPSRTGTASSSVSAVDDRPIELHWTLHEPATGGVAGQRLLLVNGLGSPLINYDAGFVIALVERGLSVVRFDNRDTGRSSRVPENRNAEGYRFDNPPYRLADMAGDAVAVLDAVGWDRAHVLGQSMGGMIAQQLAISHPDRLLTMTSLMASTGNRDHGGATAEAQAALIKPPPRDREGWIEHTVSTGRIWATPDSWDAERVRRRAARQYDYGVDVEGTGRQYRAVVASGDRDDDLRRIDVPTLVIHGSADTLIQPDGGRHTADVIPGARYVELDGYGHDLPPSHWPVIAGTVAAFVTDAMAAIAETNRTGGPGPP